LIQARENYGAETILEIYRFNETPTTYTAFTALIYSDDTVAVKGLNDAITLSDARQLIEYLKTKGVKSIDMKRKGRWRSVNIEHFRH
jgi:hypothetical protein